MKFRLSGWLGIGLLFATMPSSTNYQLHNYNYGSGGTANSTSTNYSLNANTGGTNNVQSTSTNYKARSGNNNTQQANVPPAPTFTNPASYYDKLKFVLNTGNNPTDTKFAIAISTDNFVTTKYVKSDDTVGTTLTSGDYQTYAAWGGASGQNVIGLTPATTYKIKVTAIQGKFTQTEYGPTATAATVTPSITFSIFTDSNPTPPFVTSFGQLLPATVTSAADKIWANLSTNADSGAMVYLSSVNAGLRSPSKSFTLSSATANLGAVSTGYGAQGFSTTQTSGGPLSIVSPFNVSAQNVGVITTGAQAIFSSTAPITGGSGSFKLMAKASSQTPSSSDYSDTLTVVAAASF